MSKYDEWPLADESEIERLRKIINQAQPASRWAEFMRVSMADHITIQPEPVAHDGQWWWFVAGEPVREMTGDEVLECIRAEALPTQAILVLANSYDTARHYMRGINPHRWQYVTERDVPPPVMHPTVIKCPGTRYSASFYNALLTILDRREAVTVSLTEERPV